MKIEKYFLDYGRIGAQTEVRESILRECFRELLKRT